MPFPLFPASVVFFQLHGGMVSHMLALAAPSSTVHNTYLVYQFWLLVLYERSVVLIPNTTGVESANTNVIGRRSSVARD